MHAAVGGDRVLYLYGVIPRHQRLPADAGAAVEVVPYSEVLAVVEPVCAGEFSSETLAEKLKSIEWVARLAHKHEAVLERAMRHGPVVPARLCTLFSDVEALRRSLAANEERFLVALQRVQDREEWGLKLHCDEGRLRSIAGAGDPQVSAFDAAMASASPGWAFVLRKRRDARLAEVAASRMDAVADETVGALERVAVDLRLRRLLPEAATGRPEPMVLNIAALVDVASREPFHITVSQLSERLQREGFTLEVSGPWPPYSFCDHDGGDRIDGAAESIREEGS